MRRHALALVLAAAALAVSSSRLRAQDGGHADAGVNDAGTGAASGASTRTGTGDAPPAIEDAPLPEGHRPDVTLAIEPREGLATGDLVHVVITVRLPDGDDVGVPRQPFGPFELHTQRHRDRPIDGGRREYTFEIDLLALEPGEHELPALRLRVVTADGTVGTVRTEPQRVAVQSLIANEPDAQPRPPTPPVAVMQDDYTLAWVLGILGVIWVTALVTWLVVRWWSRRPKKAAPPPPPRPAWEVAIAKLDGLSRRSRALLEQGQHVELVDGVSDALREYFGARYDFNGLESTTDEVLARLRQVRLQGATVQEVAALLGDCDLVKFAKAVPSEEECDRMIAGALRLVRVTMPGAGPIPVPAPAPASVPPPAPAPVAAPASGSAPVPAPAPAPAPASAPVPVPAPVPASDSAPIHLSLVVSSPASLGPVLSASVLGALESRVLDSGFDGTIVVALGAALPDEDEARQALRAVHAELSAALATRRSASGAPLRVVIEHLHESAHDAAREGRQPRKTVYAPPSTHATLLGDASGRQPDEDPR